MSNIYRQDIVDIELNSGSIYRSFLNHSIGEGDDMANRYGVRLFRGGEPVSAEDSEVIGLFMAPNGVNFLISETTYEGSTGTSGNTAWVQLPDDCYVVEGHFSLAIKLGGGSVVGTMRIVDGDVSHTGSSGAVAPTGSIPSSAEIIAAFEEAAELIDGVVRHDVEQTLDATSKGRARDNIGAASETDLEQEVTDRENADAEILEQIAPEFDPSELYSAGQFVTHNNTVYVFTVDHSGAWSLSDVAERSVGDGLFSLVDSVSVTSGDFDNFITPGKFYTVYGEPSSYTNAPSDESIVGLLFVYRDTTTDFVWQVFVQQYRGYIYTRFRRANGTWDGWRSSYLSQFSPLAANTDIDTLLETNTYMLRGVEYIHHAVTNNVAGILYVYNDTDSTLVYQIFVQGRTGVVYSRIKLSTGWTAWGNPWTPTRSIATLSDINSLTDSGIYTSTEVAPVPDNFPADSMVGVFIVTKHPEYDLIYQTYIETYTGKVFTRLRRTNGTWTDWLNYFTKKEISILFVGNSLTQDGIAYLPYLLKMYYPEVSFKFYMWYNGGKTLGNQYEYFINNTPCDIFSVADNSASWSNYANSRTMATILSTYKFDIVCMQEYFNYKSSYTVEDLSDWNNCRDYIQEHYTGGNALEFISLFHAPLRSSAETVFNRTKAGNALILQNTVSQDMIPIGIAVYRALSTDLDSLGDEGHLSPDGTHTQEGLPCLLQTYTALCWLFEKLSINKSVYGFPFKMTTAIYNTINVPGPNLGTGVIEGTDAQNLLAQEVAIKAYKEGKKFVMDNIYAQ